MAAKHGGYRPGSGRPKGAKTSRFKEARLTVSDLAKVHTVDAILALAVIAKTGKVEASRVAAANSLLDRAYGRPPQAVQHSGAIGTYDLTNLSDDQLAQLESILGPLALADAGGDTGGEEA